VYENFLRKTFGERFEMAIQLLQSKIINAIYAFKNDLRLAESSKKEPSPYALTAVSI